MNILLDTHIALWAIADSPRLSEKARQLILQPWSTVWVSAASIWEISIKHALQRSNMPVTGQQALRYFEKAGYRFLAVETEYAVAVESLPAHHADPFDRILVAQAMTEPMRLLTHDRLVASYGSPVEWV